MPATEAQKRATKKWRETHKKDYLEKQKGYQKTYYDKHKEAIAKYKKEFYATVIKPKRELKFNDELPEVLNYILPGSLAEMADLTNLTGI